jgi:hypothetical protein
MKMSILLGFSILVSCYSQVRNNEFNNTKGSIEVNEILYNEDSSMVLVRFCYNQGAFGYSANEWTIVDSTLNFNDFEKYKLPSAFEDLNWKSKNVVGYKYNWLGSNLKSIHNFDFPIKINNVVLDRTDFNKLTKSDRRIIDNQKISQNGEYKLVVYRYEYRAEMWDSVVHISVCPINEEVPLYGNLYIDTKIIFNKIIDIDFNKKNKVKIMLKDYYSFKLIPHSKITEPLDCNNLSKKVIMTFDYQRQNEE